MTVLISRSQYRKRLHDDKTICYIKRQYLQIVFSFSHLSFSPVKLSTTTVVTSVTNVFHFGNQSKGQEEATKA